jgi:hypothetical protein
MKEGGYFRDSQNGDIRAACKSCDWQIARRYGCAAEEPLARAVVRQAVYDHSLRFTKHVVAQVWPTRAEEDAQRQRRAL